MQLFALIVAALTASAYAQIDPTAKELLRYPHAKVDDCTDGEWKSLKCPFWKSCCAVSTLHHKRAPYCCTTGEEGCCNSEYTRWKSRPCSKEEDPAKTFVSNQRGPTWGPRSIGSTDFITAQCSKQLGAAAKCCVKELTYDTHQFCCNPDLHAKDGCC
ncbi:unnamed protein product [Cercospora beticola]|nr:unnamed protein product [Cercospora beticola]